MLTTTPHGLSGIIQTFGPLDDDFEQRHIVLFDLPYPLLYAGQTVIRARCHSLLVDNFVAVFTDIKNAGLTDEVKNYNGIYQPRNIRGASHPSTHSWGIAIDLEAEKYPLGSLNRFPQDIIDIFHKYGFFYGGDFSNRRDPMHFQFAIGY